MNYWKANGFRFDQYGIEIASGNFQARDESTLTLKIGTAFDASPLFAYDDVITVSYAASPSGPWTPYFTGRVASIPSGANGPEESIEIQLVDAWKDLGEIVYQESWAINGGNVKVPRFVFGLSDTGSPLEVGAIIGKAAEYAVANGAQMQVGSIPTGEIPVQSEIKDATCAEVINLALRFHPDWIPWIDHSTSPPTFNVTQVTSMAGVSYSVDGTGNVISFSVSEREDLIPDSVRILYESSDQVDGEVYRKIYEDLHPVSGATEGRKVLNAYVELAGMQMQIQKQRVQTDDIPTSQATAKDWLEKKFPQLKNVSQANYSVTKFDKELVPDGTLPDPINPNAERITVTDADDLPRELVRGNIEDWMRVKVGQVKFDVEITAGSSATDDEKEIIGTGKFMPFEVTCTDATTKIYKGVSSWTPGEDIPTGIAEAIYNSIVSSCRWQASITLEQENIIPPCVGKKLNITGGSSAWETMGAPISGFWFDLGSGTATIEAGPAGSLSPHEFVDLQRQMRYMPVRWFSLEERTSTKHGAEDNPSAKGDTVGGFDGPIKNVSPPQTPPPPPPFWPAFGTDTVKLSTGVVTEIVPKGTSGAIVHHVPSNITSSISITSGQAVFVKVPVLEDGSVDTSTGVTIVVDSAGASSTHYDPPIADETSGAGGTYYYKIAVYNGTESAPTYFAAGSNIQHFRELPTFKKAGGDNDIFKEYDLAAGTYKTKGLSGSGPGYTGASDNIEITNETDQLKFKVIGGNLDLQCYVAYTDTVGLITSISTSPEWVACFRNGTFVGIFTETTVPGSDATVTQKIIHRIVKG